MYYMGDRVIPVGFYTLSFEAQATMPRLRTRIIGVNDA